MKRIHCVVGARPNFIKMAPLVRVLDADPGFEARIVHSGQHYDKLLNDQVWDDLEIRQPDVNLGVGSGSHGEQTGRVLAAYEAELLACRDKGMGPDLVVVAGDVNSTLACALAAAKLHIPVAHVEAGLRSRDRAMPEEINRILTDHLSDLLLTHCAEAGENLAQEGIDARKVHQVGNLMADSLVRVLPHLDKRSDYPARLGLEPRGYALVTLHRPHAVDQADMLGKMVALLVRVAAHLPVVFPAHPRTRNSLATHGLDKLVAGAPDLMLMDPCGYVDFLNLMRHARVVLTDSGGVQEETTILGVPCLTLRENTERPVTIREGTNQLVGLDPDAIYSAAATYFEQAAPVMPKPPEGWDGRAAERVLPVLQGFFQPGRDS